MIECSAAAATDRLFPIRAPLTFALIHFRWKSRRIFLSVLATTSCKILRRNVSQALAGCELWGLSRLRMRPKCLMLTPCLQGACWSRELLARASSGERRGGKGSGRGALPMELHAQIEVLEHFVVQGEKVLREARDRLSYQYSRRVANLWWRE